MIFTSEPPDVTEKPWGKEELYKSIAPGVTPKIMTVNAGHRNSLHYHNEKDEVVHCISGNGLIQIDAKIHKLSLGVFYKIPKYIVHRIQAFDDVKVMEFSIGNYNEDDIVRLEDDYGREP